MTTPPSWTYYNPATGVAVYASGRSDRPIKITLPSAIEVTPTDAREIGEALIKAADYYTIEYRKET